MTDDEIWALWRSGKDTLDIARHFGVPEFVMARHLTRIREERRQRKRDEQPFVTFGARAT